MLDDLSTGNRANLDGLDVRVRRGHASSTPTRSSTLPSPGPTRWCTSPRSAACRAASPNPLATHHANATGTLKVLEAARRHGDLHTIVASSSSVYGGNPILPKHEELATRPLSPYAGSKLVTEGYTLAWGSSYGLPTLAFRFFNVFGPLQPAGHAYAAVIPAFVRAALTGKPLTVHGDGTQSRDFTYVGTVVAAIADAVLRKVTSPEPVNLAFGTRVDPARRDRFTRADPRPPGRTDAHRQPRRRRAAQPGRQHPAARLFPDVQAVAFADGLRTTVDWMRSTL